MKDAGLRNAFICGMLKAMTRNDDASHPPSPEQPGEQKKPAPPAKPARKQADWRPLGTVRDHFAEQMKQDKDW